MIRNIVIYDFHLLHFVMNEFFACHITSGTNLAFLGLNLFPFNIWVLQDSHVEEQINHIFQKTLFWSW